LNGVVFAPGYLLIGCGIMNKARSMRGGDAGGKQWMPGVSPALGHKDKAGFEKEFMRVGLPCASDRY